MCYQMGIRIYQLSYVIIIWDFEASRAFKLASGVRIQGINICIIHIHFSW